MSELLVGGITVKTVPLFSFVTFLFVSGPEVKKDEVMWNHKSVHFACAAKGSVLFQRFTISRQFGG